ncbi:MAG TPA: ADP-ribosylglycohydrolase family protein, partial [Solirubrobacterales bacterium]
MGAPYEFIPAGSPRLPKSAADLAMTGGGPWLPGEWTDDTAMALCLAESILGTRGDGALFDEDDLVGRYAAWAASGPKDIGITCSTALRGTPTAAAAR